MLYLTGMTSTLIGADAAALLPRSNLAVKITVTSARFVASALPFRGEPGQRSPYNPRVRYLTTEKPPTHSSSADGATQQAHLLRQTPLTPTISRFTFALPNNNNLTPHKAGQYVTLDFSPHLDIGYSHMRDDDPGSINDDFVRTFTVSSAPGTAVAGGRDGEKDGVFEVTVRKVGRVTDFLFGYFGAEAEGRRGMQELEVEVLGFGGEFEVQEQNFDDNGEGERIAFVAAGVGITPLLPSLRVLDFGRLEVLWAVRGADLGLVEDVVAQHPGVAGRVRLFVTAAGDEVEEKIKGLREKGVNVEMRRMEENDFEDVEAARYYLCTPVPMRKQLEEWLQGRELVFEDFNF